VKSISQPDIARRVDDLTSHFSTYLDIFRRENRFTDAQLQSHLRTTALRRQFGNVRDAIGSEEFLGTLRQTLESWGMNSRAARLADATSFAEAVRKQQQDIASLEDERLDGCSADVMVLTNRLWAIIDALGITRTQSRLVAGTKALHHLLPELVPPMDRAYTVVFLGWTPEGLQGREVQFFRKAFPLFANIARAIRPQQYVDVEWNSSMTKVIDNAIVGYCKHHILDEGSGRKLISELKKQGSYRAVLEKARENPRSD
jgi:hypothetical protein